MVNYLKKIEEERVRKTVLEKKLQIQKQEIQKLRNKRRLLKQQVEKDQDALALKISKEKLLISKQKLLIRKLLLFMGVGAGAYGCLIAANSIYVLFS